MTGSKNVMLFELPEKSNENWVIQLANYFQEKKSSREKMPHFESFRAGKRKSGLTARPVEVIVSSPMPNGRESNLV